MRDFEERRYPIAPGGESVFPAHRLATNVPFDSSHISLVRGRINYCTPSEYNIMLLYLRQKTKHQWRTDLLVVHMLEAGCT